MRCSHCGHEANQHDDEGECHVTILTGWNQQENRFTSHRNCECVEYAGRYDPVDTTGCPHELVTTSPRCVHCGRAVRENCEP